MYNLLVTGAFKINDTEIELLKSHGFKTIVIDHEDVLINISKENIHCIICNGFFLKNNIREFPNLRVIQLTSAGYDRVDYNYIIENKITIFNAADAYSIPIAEWVVLKVLEIYKQSRFFMLNQMEKKWKKNRSVRELSNAVVTILGYGSIGKEVSHRLKNFGVEILTVNKKPNDSSEYKSFGIESLEEILPITDVLIITLPLTKETESLINDKQLSKVKHGSILINVSRGEIIDEDALIKQIENGKIFAAALDVFRNEPFINDKFWTNESIYVTPHISFQSDQNRIRLSNIILSNLIKGDQL